MKGKSESEVTQSCQTLTDPMDYSLPGSSIHGIVQARVLEWGAIAFSVLTARDNKLFLLLIIGFAVYCISVKLPSWYLPWGRKPSLRLMIALLW